MCFPRELIRFLWGLVFSTILEQCSSMNSGVAPFLYSITSEFINSPNRLTGRRELLRGVVGRIIGWDEERLYGKEMQAVVF